MELQRTPTTLYLVLLASLILWLGAASLYRITRPHFDQGTVEFPGQSAQTFSHPFAEKKVAKSKFTLKEKLELSFLYPTIFVFYPQDALWTIKVNGHEVEAKGLPLSVTHHEGRSIDLAPFLHPGTNEIDLAMEVFWGETSLNIYVSPWDKYSLILSILVACAALGTGAFFCCFFRIKITGAEIAILLAGFLIRYLYLLGTPYFVRAYDWWGHAAYLDFVAQHLSVPNPDANWEAYQPPLYYFLVGAMTKLLLFCGMAEPQRYAVWQGFSLLCSAGVLIVGLWLGRLLHENEPKYRLYLLAVLGVAPALVFNASRVSNDVLLNLLDFLWLGFLLQFWQRPNERTWLGLSVILGLALLTKASALVLIPISILCLVLTPHVGARSKFFAALMLIVAALGIAGWYYLPRAFHENKLDSYVVGNIHQLNPKGRIDGIFAKSFVFNPFKVLRYPFVDPWGPRHEYFLEYLFKSIFVGEWFLGHTYRWVARAFILSALLLTPVFFRGIWCSFKRKTASDLPLLIVFFAVFLTHWTFVQIAPFMSSQDFRYSVVLLVPMVYFFIQGASNLPTKWGHVFRFALQLVILNSAIYLLEMALEG